MKTRLRTYQNQGLQAVLQKLRTHRSTMIVLPTGGGKTAFACALMELAARGGRRILFLAHREELVQQACDRLERFTDLRCGVEMGTRTLAGDLPDVVVASIQTMSREKRRRRFRPDAFCLLIVDECHHAPAATWRAVLDYFAPAKICGLTATPERFDGLAMGSVFETVAFVYEIRDAIEAGWLVPIRQRSVKVEGLDLSRLKARAGDFAEGELEELLMQEQVLHEMAVPIVEMSGERQTIVFTASVAHAHALAGVINRYKPSSARAVDGGMDRELRRSTLQDFSDARFQYLANVQILTEGYDNPAVSCIAMGRPTMSRSLYAQCLGRGLRISPATDKTDCLVLDLAGNAGKHSLINCTDVLDGKLDPEVRKLAQRILIADEEMTVLDALDEAADRIAEEKRARITVAARYRTVDVDPFAARPRAEPEWVAPSEKQVAILKRAGVAIGGMDRGQASRVIFQLSKQLQQPARMG